MFGCIAAGRLVQTNLNQVDVNKYVFELGEPNAIDHIVVFLLGTIPFQPGFAATVHLLWPNKEWQFLGEISNDKPSAIFRLRNANKATIQEYVESATLGISIEPTDSVKRQVSELAPRSSPSAALGALVKPTPNLSQAAELAQRILQDLYNYVNSFLIQELPPNAIPLGHIVENGYVPVKTFQTWYDNLARKVNNDPGYLAENKSA